MAKAKPAGQRAEQVFRNTASRGDYKNSPRFMPRGGISTK